MPIRLLRNIINWWRWGSSSITDKKMVVVCYVLMPDQTVESSVHYENVSLSEVKFMMDATRKKAEPDDRNSEED